MNEPQQSIPERLFRILRFLGKAIAGTEKEFTKGSIDRAIVLLSIPMILEMVMESLFAVVDLYFVGKLNVNALATVALTESMIFLVFAVAIGLSMATTAMVARRVGEKQPEEASKAAYQAMVLTFIVGVIISLVGLFFPKDLLRMMGASEELVEYGYRYTQILLGGNLSIMFLFLINAIFRGAGDASIAMRTLWLANGLNIVLDPLLIFGFGSFEGFGVEGAAIATTIGRSIGVAFQLYVLFKGKGMVQMAVRHMRVDMEIVNRLFKISLGGMGQFLIGSASWVFLVRIISIFGSEALAGYQVSLRIIIFTILPSWGMANAAATLVGQNLGAGLPDRAEKSVWRTAVFNMGFLGVVSVIFFTYAEFFVGIFTTEPAVMEVGIRALKIICLGYLFFAYGMVISQSFNGAGDTRTPTIINFVAYWIIQIPLAYFLAVYLEMGPVGVFITICVTLTILALMAIYLFRQGKWKRVAI